MVISHHCTNSECLGTVFQVTGIGMYRCRCGRCKTIIGEHLCAEDCDDTATPLTWLKKLEPPSPDETTDEREELTA